MALRYITEHKVDGEPYIVYTMRKSRNNNRKVIRGGENGGRILQSDIYRIRTDVSGKVTVPVGKIELSKRIFDNREKFSEMLSEFIRESYSYN